MAKAAATERPLDASMRVVVLHGKDNYLRSEHAKRFREMLEAKFGVIDSIAFDGASVSTATLLDELRSWGLMQTHKLVMLDNADQFLAAEERRRALERYVEEPMNDSTLLMRSTTWRPGNLDKMIDKAGGTLIKCEPPNEESAEAFCRRRSDKQHRVPIDDDAARLLVERLGADLLRLDSELGKLAAMVCDRPQPRITRDDVAEVVGLGREEQAWAIQDALVSGDAEAALTKLWELLDVGRVPEQLVVWSTVELVRKIHEVSRRLAQGEGEESVAKAVGLWGPTRGAILRLGRKLQPAVAARLLEAAIGLDLNARRGVTRDLVRRLQGFSVELTDSFGR
ncbi:MAG: DNA polymerase III subunit delta [Phycisphaerales bacterium]